MLSAVSIEAINRWVPGIAQRLGCDRLFVVEPEIVLRGLGMPASGHRAGRRTSPPLPAARTSLLANVPNASVTQLGLRGYVTLDLNTDQMEAGGGLAVQRQEERDLAGKVVIITGASRGVGRQAAYAFARRGANLVLAARTVEPDS